MISVGAGYQACHHIRANQVFFSFKEIRTSAILPNAVGRLINSLSELPVKT
jgi:ornithine cyclodeaminase/alanine dehydrogenase-like protein (mu-crystallin family)